MSLCGSINMRVITILALLASIILAVNVGIVLHESGHAIGGLIFGGELRRISIHPFSKSSADFRVLPEEGNLLMWAGGFLFGGLLTFLPALLAMRWKSTWSLPFLLFGVSGGFLNGIYLVMGTLLKEGDAGVLFDMGLSPVFLIVWGFSLMLIGGIMGIFTLPRMGLDIHDTFRKRLVLFSGGLLPYVAVFVLYQIIVNPPDVRWYYFLAWLLAAVSFIPLSALTTCFLHSRLSRIFDLRPIPVKMKPALVLLGMAVILIIYELAIL
mgnify:CR=1 FL=1